MGSCGGKHDVISQNSLVNVKTAAVENVHRSRNNRRHCASTRQSSQAREITEDIGGKTFHDQIRLEKQKPISNKELLEINTDQQIDKFCKNINRSETNLQVSSKCDVGTDCLEEIEYSQPDSFILAETMTEQIDNVYNQVLGDKYLMGDSDREWLEVINEVDELNLDGGDNISLVESEIIEECAIEENKESEKQPIDDKENLKEAPGATGKIKRKSSQPDADTKRKEQTTCNKHVKNEKKKLDKNKANKSKHEKLWTSRTKEKPSWLEEKIYTTKGKDGMVFKIKIMRKSTKEEASSGNKKGIGKTSFKTHCNKNFL